MSFDPNNLTDKQKLDAIAVFLRWNITSDEVALEMLEQIWYVVMVGRLKPEEPTGESNKIGKGEI